MLLQSSLQKRLSCPKWNPKIFLPALFHPSPFRPFITLAIETSCDDTSLALLHTPSPTTTTPATLLYHTCSTSDNRPYRGVNPPTTLAAHDRTIGPLLTEAMARLREAQAGGGGGGSGGHENLQPDLVAVTRGPGMSANLAVGINVAKGVAGALRIPLVGVNHMQGHALTSRLVAALEARTKTGDGPVGGPLTPEFPFLSLLVSGGHTMLVLSTSITNHKILAEAQNIALGDALDKCARHILPPDILQASPDVMYARTLESFAFPPDSPVFYHNYQPPRKRVDEITPRKHPSGWTLRPFLAGSRKMEYNFSDAESQIIHLLRARNNQMPPDSRRALAIDIQRLVFEHLVGRVLLALEKDGDAALKGIETLVISGGVACNQFLMRIAREMLAARGFGGIQVVVPPVELCTDNAAMIAWAGVEMYAEGWRSNLSILPARKWSIDPGKDGGIFGLNGWVKEER